MFQEEEQSAKLTKPHEGVFFGFISRNKPLVFVALGLLVLIVVAVLLLSLYLKSRTNNSSDAAQPEKLETIATNTPQSFLPGEDNNKTDNIEEKIIFSDLEKYNFGDFYLEPLNTPDFSFKDYTLPLNTKIDVLNYYDLSRKINLDDSLSGLNENGFALLSLPDKNINDFYSTYSWLNEKEIPLLITSDFLVHYHQNNIKKVFKDIEEGVFYDNLHYICQKLYESSRIRYENRLAKIGNINDQILEGERLAMAYFAVALKLLEPEPQQIDSVGKDNTKFSKQEADNLYFNILPYLQGDAGEEIKLIKSAQGIKKSPVLLYQKNYSDFIVPAEYRRTEKLYNFYLASTWLNSVFPLVIKDSSCPDCLLDKEDARLSLIATSLIAQDFAANQDLKNRWALIYKLISYSKGLRDGLTYLQYNAAITELFGNQPDLENIFAGNNKEADKNLEKLRNKLLSFSFNKIQGGLDVKNDKTKIGFKLLSDYYLPNDYIFSRLSGDSVGDHLGDRIDPSNVTACKDGKKKCNGFSLDVVGLVADGVESSPVWQNNTNFSNYLNTFLSLQAELKSSTIWQTNNFWSTLGVVDDIFEDNNGQMQIYHRSNFWSQRLINSAVSAWIDLQLPLEQLSLSGKNNQKTGLSSGVAFNENFYIEPNYNLTQKIIADNEMILGMLDALRVTEQLTSVSLTLKDENTKLKQILEIIKKEISGESLGLEDNNFIGSLAGEYQILQKPNNQLYLKTGGANLYEGLEVKLMALVYENNEGKFLVVGPIFSYQEKRQ